MQSIARLCDAQQHEEVAVGVLWPCAIAVWLSFHAVCAEAARLSWCSSAVHV